MSLPHGGQLVNQALSEEHKKEAIKRAGLFKKLKLDREQVSDLKNIAFGAFSPLNGFLKQEDFERVVKEMRLANGTLWPMPIVLDISEQDYQRLKNEKYILLIDFIGKPLGLLKEPEFYQADKKEWAKNVFGTTDRNHPGVEAVFQTNNWLLGGAIKLIDESKDIFPEYNLRPQETRRIFQDKGWQTVAAFQTRNVPHRAHEFLQKKALEQVDGLFIQPVIGQKKLADFKDEFILGGYRLLIDKFYPQTRTLLAVLPLKMRYAGPREAVLHALIRKNFGCSHFIVGRDHAGVGNYYAPTAAQQIFEQFSPEEIGIEILKYPLVIWCPWCSEFVFENGCVHKPQTQMVFSGSKLRERIERRLDVPSYFMRPEVYHLISQSVRPLADNMYQKHLNSNEGRKGFVLWFTGLPCSGKSTVANQVFAYLQKQDMAVERLDGDIVRQSLAKDLGFTKEDRDENIRRISFVSRALSKNGVGVVASFISPYRHQREGVRQAVENFIEVFCDCPLEVCEQRDNKKMYEKARRGEIENFTGISDPYEAPENPEVILKTAQEPIEQSVSKVINTLKEKGLL